MSKIKTFEVQLSEIVSVGATCKNFEVQFETPFCADIACEYNEQTGVIIVEVGPDCEDTCFYLVIKCLDPCIDCYNRHKVCLCAGDSDCDGCSTCDNGICVSECTEDEFCDGTVCVECNSEIPCPDGKICENGACVCPDGQFENERGECVPCLEGTCPPCHVCTPEGCKPIDCGDKVCDPLTGKCVECVGSGDCGPNEICKDNECVCKEGYVRDANGNCVKGRECDTDIDCPDCFICDQFGNCIEKECPAGEICIDDECVIPCEHGGDCPPGFGCDGEKCVECSELDCASLECENVLGCGCNRENQCVDTTKCSGDCATYADCGPGCTCYDGECISCEDLPCDLCDTPNCACIGGKCVSTNKECFDDVIISVDPNNCDLKGTAIINDGCNCTPLSVTFEPTRIYSNNQIEITAKLRKGSAESFIDAKGNSVLNNTNRIDIAENELPSSGTIEFKVIATLYEIDDNGRRSGQNFTVDYSTKTFDFTNVAEVSRNLDFLKVGSVIQYAVDPGDPEIDHKVYGVRVHIEHTADFEVPGSGCTYVDGTVIKNDPLSSTEFDKLFDGNNSNNTFLEEYEVFVSSQLRNPFFTWYRTPSTGTGFDLSDPNQAFRKMYISGSGGEYVDTLVDWEDGLYNGYKYALHVDCPCDNNLDVFGKALFCNPENITGTFQDCGSKFTSNIFTPCDVNMYVDPSQVPSDAIVKYEITFDGNSPSNITDNVFIYNNFGNLLNSNSEDFFQELENNNKPIGEVKIRIFTISTDICEITIPGPDVDERILDYELNCAGFTPQVRLYKAGKTGGLITDLQLSDGSANDNGSYWSLTKNGKAQNSFDVIATFDNGCIVEEKITVDICECLQINASFNTDPIIVGQNADVQITISGGYPGYTILILDPLNNDSAVAQISTNDSLVNLTIPEISDQNYKIRVIDSNRCDKERVLSFEAINTDLGFIPSNVCEGEDSTFTINNIPTTMIGNVLHYDENSPAFPKTVTINQSGSQIVNIGQKTSDTTLTNFKLKTSGGNLITSYTDTIEITVSEKPEVISTNIVDGNGDSISGGICQNSTAYFRVTGTEGATVTINPGNISQVIGPNGYVDIAVNTSLSGNFSYQVISIEKNGCSGTELGTTRTIEIESSDISISGTQECDFTFTRVIFTVEGVPSVNPNNFTATYTDQNGSGTVNKIWSLVNGNQLMYEFDDEDYFTITGTYTTNGGCSVSNTMNFNDCEDEMNPLLTVSKKSSCNGDPVEIDVNDLQIQDGAGTVIDINPGEYNVNLIYNGSTVDTAVEGGTLTFTPSSAGNSISFEYQINIISGSLSGQTFIVSDIISSPTLTFDVTSTPVQSNQGESVTFFTVGDEFDSYEWTIGANPPVTTTTNNYIWTSPFSNTTTTVTVVGTGYKQGASGNICSMTATMEHTTALNCPPSIPLSSNSDPVTVSPETCVGNDGEVVIEESDLTVLGFTAPYSYSGDLTGGSLVGTTYTVSSLSVGDKIGLITDANGCIIGYDIYVGLISEDLLSLNGDFEDCTVGIGQSSTCSVVTTSLGSPDVWSATVPLSNTFGPAGLFPPSGNKFLGFIAGETSEAINIDVTLDPSTSYTLTYYEAFGGTGNNGGTGTPIPDQTTGRFTINIGSELDVAPSNILTFKGFGNQQWVSRSITFNTDDTGSGSQTISFIADDGASGINANNSNIMYLCLDDIQLKENCI